MKHEEMYNQWRLARRQVDVSPDFSDRVMRQVRLTPSCPSPPGLPWPRLIERINVSAWAKVAIIALASLVGLGRVLLTIHLLLSL